MGSSPLIRAQSLWVFWACCFLGEGPSIDTVPSPLPRGVQSENKWTSCHFNIMPKQRRYMCFNLISVLKSSLSRYKMP
jgi:hypothetical protein